MKIKSIEATNFRSFEKIDVHLSDFNIILGANSSGKSNFIQLFRFLLDWHHFDLDTAVALQGGAEYFKNFNCSKNEKIMIRCEFLFGDQEYRLRPFFFPLENKSPKIVVSGAIFKATLGFPTSTRCDAFTQELELEFKIVDDGTIGKVTFVQSGNKISALANLDQRFLHINEAILKAFKYPDPESSKTFLVNSWAIWSILRTRMNLNFGLFDFDVKLPKKASQITGKNELEEDGHNLAVVLRAIARDPIKKKQFLRILGDILPFYSDVKTESLTDKTFLFQLRENFQKRPYIPSTFLSDGTINIVLTIVALFFERHHALFFEEPERNIHPHLIKKIVDLMQERSSTKQIFVSTHNPIFVKASRLEDLLIISRDRVKGVSKISKPSESIEVKRFLSHDLGVDDLFIQNLLEESQE